MVSKFKKATILKSPKKAAERIERIIKEMSGKGQVKIGLPKGSNDYPDGTSVIMVGAVHEFGSPVNNVPERSYLRATMQANRRLYKKLMSKLGAMIATGEITANKALNLLGLQVQADVIERISSGISPELTSRDGTPLVDTGHFRQSIVHVVDQ